MSDDPVGDERPTSPDLLPKALRADGSERFEMIDLLGEGGVGRVLLCHDRALGRRVALKMGLPEVPHASKLVEREARILGQLEHPNIVPIYDLSDDVDCGSFYVMRLLAQPTLEDAMRALREGRSKLTHGLLLRKFIQVCEAIAYAHHRGIVHCDLKPANVLLGSFGEVFVADWGFAHVIGRDARARGGTAGFMPPEQLAHGAGVDGRADIFALGVMLYQLLTDELPYERIDFDAWRAAEERGEPAFSTAVPPSQRVRQRLVPPELDELCMSALALDKDERLSSAWHMARELEQFLEGTRDKKRRMRRADELCAEGAALTDAYRDLCAARPERLAELAELRAATPPWETGERKQALADADDQLAVLDALAERTSQTATSLFERALDEVGDHAEARRGLTQVFWLMSEQARTVHEELRRKHYEALALEHDDGTLRTRLARGGTLRFEAPGFDELVLDDGANPRRLAPLPEMLVVDAASYVATLHAASKPPLAVPIMVWAGRESLLAVDASSVPTDPDEALVPAGVALVGGHDSSVWGRELAEVEVAAFVIRRTPVTFAEYFEFLDDAGEDEALLPRGDADEPLFARDGASWMPRAVIPLVAVGLDLARISKVPVFGVGVEGARAYAGWRAQRSGVAWRLPSEIEWEKAARGVDGRAYPWGGRFDATLCNMRESQSEAPRAQPVASVPSDVSPYDVRDMAGGIADWVEPAGGLAVSKGGAWCDWASDCHAGARRSYRPGEHTIRVGFRLARSI